MSNYGMGTTVVNYYRKKDDKDEFVPKVSSCHLKSSSNTEGISLTSVSRLS